MTPVDKLARTLYLTEDESYDHRYVGWPRLCEDFRDEAAMWRRKARKMMRLVDEARK